MIWDINNKNHIITFWVSGVTPMAMTFKVTSVMLLLLLALSPLGCSRSEKGQDVQVFGKICSPSQERSKVDWYLLPGGSQQSLLFSHYYVELELRTPSGRISPLPKVAAYFYGENGSVLNIRVLTKNEDTRADAPFIVYLDTDGYTEFLHLSKEDISSALYLTVCIEGKGFKAKLPTFAELRGKDVSDLNFVATTTIPDIGGAKIATIDDWPKAWQSALGGPSIAADYLRPPAILRRQKNQSAYYFYYLKPVPFDKLKEPRNLRLLDDDIARDMVASGITSDIELVHVTVTPMMK